MKLVKIKGSDVRLEYPQKRVVVEVDPIIGEKWEYHDDTSRPPKEVRKIPTIVEDNGDGTYTSWSFGIWGPVGSCGKLSDGVEVVPLAKRDEKHAEQIRKGMARSLEQQKNMFEIFKARA